MGSVGTAGAAITLQKVRVAFEIAWRMFRLGTGYVSRPEVSIVFNQICTWTSMIFVTFRFGSS
ncbi:MAG: hypothetical protein WAK54_31725 [Bradyrhizobium sp.]